MLHCSSSSGPCCIRTLHYDPSLFSGPAWYPSSVDLHGMTLQWTCSFSELLKSLLHKAVIHDAESVFIPIPKKGNTKECLNYPTIALISHTSKVMQNPSSEASAVHTSRTSSCRSWVLKRHTKQRSNCQHSLDHGESKGVSEKHLFLLH